MEGISTSISGLLIAVKEIFKPKKTLEGTSSASEGPEDSENAQRQTIRVAITYSHILHYFQ